MDKERQKRDAVQLVSKEEKVAHRKAFTRAGLPLKAWLLRHEKA
ncbi:MAG: hypothetical protein R3Y11_07200 [Pseudomonadota bacterium]